MSAALPAGPSRFQKLSFVIILAGISAGFLYMVRYFLLTLLMAAVFTALTYPLYQLLLRPLKKPALAALATLTLLLVLLVLPVLGVIGVAYQEAWAFFASIDFAALPGRLARLARDAQDRFPSLFERLNLTPEEIRVNVANISKEALQFVLRQGAGWSVAAVGNLANFFLMLFMMFFFYLDGPAMLRRIKRWSPLRDDYEEILIRKFMTVSRAALKGILVIGVIQGSIGTLLFWLVGMRSPVFLGVIIVISAALPVVGAGMVWIPAALYLILQGQIGAGIAVVAVGALVLSPVDYVLRPRLVGQDIKMHDIMVLLSTLGGLALFGLPGFVIGPILAALFLAIWHMYEEVFAADLDRNRVPVPPPADGARPASPQPDAAALPQSAPSASTPVA